MNAPRGIALVFLLLLAACQPQAPVVILVEGGQARALRPVSGTPRDLLAQAGAPLGANDRVLLNGVPFPADGVLPQAAALQLQIRRAVSVTIVTPQGEFVFESPAETVGEALTEAGARLTPNDLLDPPAETRMTQPLTVTYVPARELNVSIGEKTLKIRSAKRTVGEALAEAGIALTGADYSIPPEGETLPPDGNIRVVRVSETMSVSFESIPYRAQWIEDAALPMGEEQIVQPGFKGIAMLRERIRYEDGVETKRETEERVTLRAPQDKIARRGSKIVLADINGLNYWLATQMYATVYSPCASGTGSCSYGTASGARAGYGVVAVDSSVYPYLAGMRVYVPGYGVGVIGDVGGGSIIESKLGVPRAKWIDLGFDDGKIINLTGWVTVYFLAPAPAEIPPFLR